jgi:hypothetical protein
MSDSPIYPLTVRTGDTESISFTLLDNGTPINITGRTYRGQVRSTAASTAILASFSCSITNGTAGQFTCTLTATTTAALSAGQAVYDVEETYGSVVNTLIQGPVFIVQDVTR